MSEETSAAAAGRDHRGNVGPRAGARPRAGQPRSARRLRRAPPRGRGARRPRTARCHRHRRGRVAQGGYPSDRDTGAWRTGRARRARQQRLVAWSCAARPARGHRLRRPGARARDQPRRSVPPDEGAPWIAGRVGARRTAPAGGERLERRGRHRRTPGWGAYGASKAALHHLSRIWNEELASEGIRIVSVDPGDMDTPLHALAVPDADRSTLKSPDAAAREIADLIAAAVRGARRSSRGSARSFNDPGQQGDAAAAGREAARHR